MEKVLLPKKGAELYPNKLSCSIPIPSVLGGLLLWRGARRGQGVAWSGSHGPGAWGDRLACACLLPPPLQVPVPQPDPRSRTQRTYLRIPVTAGPAGNPIKMNLAEKTLARKLVSLPEPGGGASSRLFESMDENPQKPAEELARAGVGRRGQAGPPAPFSLPLAAWPLCAFQRP